MASEEISSSYSGEGFPSRLRGGSDATRSSSGLSLSGSSVPSPFYVHVDSSGESPVTVIADGSVYCGNVKVDITGMQLPTNGTVYIDITCENGEYVGQLTTTQPTQSAKRVFRKLYDVSEGKVTMDYRLTPVFPVYN